MFLLFFYSKRKKKSGDKIQAEFREKEELTTEIVSGIRPVRKLRKQSIFLLGGFQVIDKNGEDSTASFKPLLKNLFLIVLLNTIKNGKGISFTKLKEILWFDKTEESANNNRGVAMSKIRQIMEGVGEVHFNKQGVYWSMDFSSDIYCDYYETLILIRRIRESNKPAIEDINRLITLVSAGELLPNIQVEWVDAFKSEFTDELIEILVQLVNNQESGFDDSVYINIANAIFVHDPLNEDALKLKCSLLVKTGKNGLALNTYSMFIKEYAISFGTKYRYSFDQILDKSIIG